LHSHGGTLLRPNAEFRGARANVAEARRTL
jgi:hypothetical protein